jgi:hypothetical protein
MSKAEAIEAMKDGKKVTHRYFSPEEWMTMKKSYLEGWMIHLEDSVICSPAEFWRWRTDPTFDTDWSIYME